MLFGQRKHKTFNYKPKYGKRQDELQVEDASASKSFANKWRQQTGHKVQMKGLLPVRTLILLLVLLLICMYILEKNYM
jgi:type VI protein secretion system component VasF